MSQKYPNLSGFSESDQRYFPRWTVRNRISYYRENTPASSEGFTKDLSCSGACIAVSDKLNEYEKIKLVIHLSDTENVTVSGRIRWFKDLGLQKIAGVNFLNIEQDEQDLILQHAFEVDQKQVVNHWFKGWKKPDNK